MLEIIKRSNSIEKIRLSLSYIIPPKWHDTSVGMVIMDKYVC